MDYITPEQVLFIHYCLIEETGGRHGIGDLALLQSAIERPKATFAAEDLYPGLLTKAASLMHSLIKNHPFIDGNKRTAITAASIFLIRNGHAITASNAELERFTLKVAAEYVELDEIVGWFDRHTKESKASE